MPSFVGIKNSNVEVTVSDRDEVQICPKCTFPNYSSARQCLDCGHPLLGSNIRWLRANMVGKCNNPTCGSFVCVKDSKCKRCGMSIGDNAEIFPHQKADLSSDQMAEFVLVCPSCNTQNPANASHCCNCGFSLEDVDPTCETGICNTLTVTFSNIRTNASTVITLKENEPISIGREDALRELFMDSMTFVHRKRHALLFFRKETVWITAVNENGVFIEGVRLDDDVESAVLSNSIIELGDSSLNKYKAAALRISY